MVTITLLAVAGSALTIRPLPVVRVPTPPHLQRCAVCAAGRAPDSQDAATWLSDGDDTPEAVQKVLLSLFDGCIEIAEAIETASCDSTSCFNEFRTLQEELAIDLLAEQVLFDLLGQTGLVKTASSESDKILRELSPDGKLSVTLDPIDASTIIDTNFAVGSIFAIWGTPTLVNVTGRKLLAAGTCTYGPRTVLTVALADRPGVSELVLVDGEWLISNVFSSMREGKLFAPGNLRATTTNPGFDALVRYWHENRYQLRYTGCMVPDVVQLLVKGCGVFVNPATPGSRPRLRLLYEAIPMAFLMEKAGGASSDGEASLLDVTVRDPDDRTQVALGSVGEVARFDEMVGPQSRLEAAVSKVA